MARELPRHARWPGWPLSVFLTAVAAGLALLLLSGLGSVAGWPPALGVAALIVGLTGCWCLVVVQLLTSPRGPVGLETALAAVGAGPPWLFVGMLLARPTSANGELLPEVVLSPTLAVILTPALVGWLLALAWRLLRFAPELPRA